jgi:hypothetical protein
MNNKVIQPEDRAHNIIKVYSKPSETELAKLIYDDDVLLYVDWGFTEKPISWQSLDSTAQEGYTRIARVVLDKFYHRIQPYSDGAPRDHGYEICDRSQGASIGISRRKLRDTICEEIGIVNDEALDSIAISIIRVLRI